MTDSNWRMKMLDVFEGESTTEKAEREAKERGEKEARRRSDSLRHALIDQYASTKWWLR